MTKTRSTSRSSTPYVTDQMAATVTRSSNNSPHTNSMMSSPKDSKRNIVGKVEGELVLSSACAHLFRLPRSFPRIHPSSPQTTVPELSHHR